MTVARSGGRLVAALVPLAVLAVMHVLAAPTQASPVPYISPGIAATAAVTAGLALLVAVVVALNAGRIRDLGDAAGLGMLAVAFGVVALEGAASLGLGIGVALSSMAFAVGSSAGGRSVPSWRGRVIGIVVVFVLVEACLAAILVGGGLTGDGQLAPVLLVGGAFVLAIAALTGFDEPARATGLGVAASATLAIALAGSIHNERSIGAVAVAIAAAVIGWSMVVFRRHDASAAQLPTATTAGAEPEFDETSRLFRELRATLNDLAASHRTIELQRAEIERASSIDPLTGLASRSTTLDRLRVETAEARRYAHPVSVVLLDIDDFAQLNHEHGQQVGDTILNEVALRLRLRVREADALGRIGSDAFLAILPHTDEGGAASFAQAVLDRLIDRRFGTSHGEMSMSLSIGIALMRPGMTLGHEELLAAAEEALASAKAAGGNRIAFDRLHGLARLDGRRDPAASDPDDQPADAAEGEADA